MLWVNYKLSRKYICNLSGRSFQDELIFVDFIYNLFCMNIPSVKIAGLRITCCMIECRLKSLFLL